MEGVMPSLMENHCALIAAISLLQRQKIIECALFSKHAAQVLVHARVIAGNTSRDKLAYGYSPRYDDIRLLDDFDLLNPSSEDYSVLQHSA